MDEKTLVPETVRSGGGALYVERFRILLNFAGSLLWREFEVATTSDTEKHSGIKPLPVYQEEEDKKIVGDIANAGGQNEVLEFRAVRKDATKDVVPLLRAKRPDFGEVYPIAAVSRGFGHLIIGGMHTKNPSEFEKLVATIDNFCDWQFEKT